jgi:superoxide dismutase, Cu-Zn family
MRGWQLSAAAVACVLIASSPVLAAELRAEIKQATPTGTGDVLGTVTIEDGANGASIRTALKGLPPGPHGFHVHQNGSCQPTAPNNQPVPAGAAGGHYDPNNTGNHMGPEGSGHVGDLPLLQVGQDGAANQALTAPRIKDLAGLKGKAVVIHAGGDNYSDEPQPLGGGGGRIACGILE